MFNSELKQQSNSQPGGYFWRLIIGVWGVLSVIMASQLYTHMPKTESPVTWYAIYLFEALYCAQWIGLVPVSVWLARRLPFQGRKFLIAIPVHIITGITLSMLTMGVRSILNWAILRKMQQPLTIEYILGYLTVALDYGMMSYVLNLLFAYSSEYYNRLRERELVAAQLESELGRAQLHALKMQLHPHFFFNTLNTISVLIRKQENDLAVEMIARLSKFLRKSLEKGNTQEVSLKEELESIDLYLSIQQVRFQDKLIVKCSIHPATLDAYVPSLILQPIVENAIQHGISKRENAGLLEIISERENGSLHIRITDDGPGIANDWRNSNGIGLQNTKSRLQSLYGNASTFDLQTKNGHGATAHLVLPYHERSTITE